MNIPIKDLVKPFSIGCAAGLVIAIAVIMTNLFKATENSGESTIRIVSIPIAHLVNTDKGFTVSTGPYTILYVLITGVATAAAYKLVRRAV